MLLAVSQNRPAVPRNMPRERRLPQGVTERLSRDTSFLGHLGRRYLICGGCHVTILLAKAGYAFNPWVP